MQPVLKVSRADVERIVRRDLPAADPGLVFDALDAYGRERSEEAGRARVHLAALKLADGSLEDLRHHIAAARLDPRDVIAAAEYPLAVARWPRTAAMPPDEQQRMYDSDWEQYRRWLERP